MNKSVVAILIAVCAAVFGISANALLTYYDENKRAEEGFSQLLPDDLSGADATTADGGNNAFDLLLPYYLSLKEQNEDFVGWLRIPGTRISYPVMQTPDDPEFYLRRDFDKKHSMAGTLFASEISDVTTPSDVVLIYGHRMRARTMFGTLGDWLEEDYFKRNQKIVFDTLTERNEYKIYGVLIQKVNTGLEFQYYNYKQFHTREVFDSFMAGIDASIRIADPAVRPAFGDKILLLSTCDFTMEDGRLVMIAVRQ